VRFYRIIYQAIDDIKAAMAGLLEPIYREVALGKAEIRATFNVSKVGVIGGAYVLEGKLPEVPM
jgi:translation initiation factor IF-2